MKQSPSSTFDPALNKEPDPTASACIGCKKRFSHQTPGFQCDCGASFVCGKCAGHCRFQSPMQEHASPCEPAAFPCSKGRENGRKRVPSVGSRDGGEKRETRCVSMAPTGKHYSRNRIPTRSDERFLVDGKEKLKATQEPDRSTSRDLYAWTRTDTSSSMPAAGESVLSKPSDTSSSFPPPDERPGPPSLLQAENSQRACMAGAQEGQPRLLGIELSTTSAPSSRQSTRDGATGMIGRNAFSPSQEGKEWRNPLCCTSGAPDDGQKKRWGGSREENGSPSACGEGEAHSRRDRRKGVLVEEKRSPASSGAASSLSHPFFPITGPTTSFSLAESSLQKGVKGPVCDDSYEKLSCAAASSSARKAKDDVSGSLVPDPAEVSSSGCAPASLVVSLPSSSLGRACRRWGVGGGPPLPLSTTFLIREEGLASVEVRGDGNLSCSASPSRYLLPARLESSGSSIVSPRIRMTTEDTDDSRRPSDVKPFPFGSTSLPMEVPSSSLHARTAVLQGTSPPAPATPSVVLWEAAVEKDNERQGAEVRATSSSPATNDRTTTTSTSFFSLKGRYDCPEEEKAEEMEHHMHKEVPARENAVSTVSSPTSSPLSWPTFSPTRVRSPCSLFWRMSAKEDAGEKEPRSVTATWPPPYSPSSFLSAVMKRHFSTTGLSTTEWTPPPCTGHTRIECNAKPRALRSRSHATSTESPPTSFHPCTLIFSPLTSSERSLPFHSAWSSAFASREEAPLPREDLPHLFLAASVSYQAGEVEPRRRTSEGGRGKGDPTPQMVVRQARKSCCILLIFIDERRKWSNITTTVAGSHQKRKCTTPCSPVRVAVDDDLSKPVTSRHDVCGDAKGYDPSPTSFSSLSSTMPNCSCTLPSCEVSPTTNATIEEEEPARDTNHTGRDAKEAKMARHGGPPLTTQRRTSLEMGEHYTAASPSVSKTGEYETCEKKQTNEEVAHRCLHGLSSEGLLSCVMQHCAKWHSSSSPIVSASQAFSLGCPSMGKGPPFETMYTLDSHGKWASSSPGGHRGSTRCLSRPDVSTASPAAGAAVLGREEGPQGRTLPSSHTERTPIMTLGRRAARPFLTLGPFFHTPVLQYVKHIVPFPLHSSSSPSSLPSSSGVSPSSWNRESRSRMTCLRKEGGTCWGRPGDPTARTPAFASPSRPPSSSFCASSVTGNTPVPPPPPPSSSWTPLPCLGVPIRLVGMTEKNLLDTSSVQDIANVQQPSPFFWSSSSREYRPPSSFPCFPLLPTLSFSSPFHSTLSSAYATSEASLGYDPLIPFTVPSHCFSCVDPRSHTAGSTFMNPMMHGMHVGPGELFLPQACIFIVLRSLPPLCCRRLTNSSTFMCSPCSCGSHSPLFAGSSSLFTSTSASSEIKKGTPIRGASRSSASSFTLASPSVFPRPPCTHSSFDKDHTANTNRASAKCSTRVPTTMSPSSANRFLQPSPGGVLSKEKSGMTRKAPEEKEKEVLAPRLGSPVQMEQRREGKLEKATTRTHPSFVPSQRVYPYLSFSVPKQQHTRRKSHHHQTNENGKHDKWVKSGGGGDDIAVCTTVEERNMGSLSSVSATASSSSPTPYSPQGCDRVTHSFNGPRFRQWLQNVFKTYGDVPFLSAIDVAVEGDEEEHPPPLHHHRQRHLAQRHSHPVTSSHVAKEVKDQKKNRSGYEWSNVHGGLNKKYMEEHVKGKEKKAQKQRERKEETRSATAPIISIMTSNDCCPHKASFPPFASHDHRPPQLSPSSSFVLETQDTLKDVVSEQTWNRRGRNSGNHNPKGSTDSRRFHRLHQEQMASFTNTLEEMKSFQMMMEHYGFHYTRCSAPLNRDGPCCACCHSRHAALSSYPISTTEELSKEVENHIRALVIRMMEHDEERYQNEIRSA